MFLIHPFWGPKRRNCFLPPNVLGHNSAPCSRKACRSCRKKTPKSYVLSPDVFAETKNSPCGSCIGQKSLKNTHICLVGQNVLRELRRPKELNKTTKVDVSGEKQTLQQKTYPNITNLDIFSIFQICSAFPIQAVTLYLRSRCNRIRGQEYHQRTSVASEDTSSIRRQEWHQMSRVASGDKSSIR